MAKKINIGVTGAAGRMGRDIITAALNKTDLFSAVIAFEANHSQHIGSAICDGQVTLQSIDELPNADIDVLIDFSTPDATVPMATVCQQNKINMVIGTTGFSDAQKQTLKNCCDNIAILIAQNMSIGVNATYQLAAHAATLLRAGRLGGGYDIEICEAHHRHKKDAPSGTALRLGESIATATGGNFNQDAVFNRDRQAAAERGTDEIGFSVVRGGDIFGEHKVIFAGTGEQIEIIHRSNSRQNYVAGALAAATFIATAPANFYDGMDAVFNL